MEWAVDKNHLISAVRGGNLQTVGDLVKLFGLSSAKEWSEGYDLLLIALERRHVDIAKLLIVSAGSKVNSNSKTYSITPLHYAAMYGDTETVKLLLDRNAKIDAKDECGRTSLYLAVEKNRINVVVLLLNRRACVNASNRDGMTPLHVASKECYSEIVKILLNYGARINPTSYLTPKQNFREGYTPLHYAVEKGSQEIIKLLLENNTDVDITALRGTSLHIAAEQGYLQIVADLLNCGANVNSVHTSSGYMPLHLASVRGNTEIVRLLLIEGANVNAVTKDNRIPLSLATEKGHETIVKLLLEHGADANAEEKFAHDKILLGTPLHIAAREGYQRIVENLLNHGASVNSACAPTGYTPLHLACASGNMSTIEWILSKGADVNVIAKDSLTPIYIAIEKGYRSVVKLLLEHGADVDAQNQHGKTVLHFAVEQGHSDIIKDILMFCPDLNNENNKSSLNIAIYNLKDKYRNIVENLLEYGFTVNVKDINNCKLVHCAVMSGYLEIVADLLFNGADINMTYFRGWTLLHSATFYRQEEIAELLISCGADVNAEDSSKKSPITYAVENLDVKITKLLLINGTNLNDNPYLLNAAIKKGSTKIVELLLQSNSNVDINSCDFQRTTLQSIKGDTSKMCHVNSRTRKGKKIVRKTIHLNNQAIVNAQKDDGNTALHIATYRGHDEIVEILLRYGAAVDSRAKCDMTPLHVAAQVGYPRIVKILLKFGADINSVDKYGRTALHIACKYVHGDVVTILLESGADINIISEHNLTALDFAVPSTIVAYWRRDDKYYDSDDDLDRDDEIYCHQEIAEILLHHLVKIMAKKVFVIKQYLHTIDTNSNLRRCYACCECEIKKMKSKKVGNSNVSFYDILTRDVHQLAIYAKNKSVLDVFLLNEYKEMFPRYANVLETQFKKGQERVGLLKPSMKSLNFLFGCELPHLFTNEMFSYLSNLDLENLICAGPDVIVAES